MRLGIDFDNTLIQYDDVFYRAALEQGIIPQDLPANKTRIRDYIRTHSGNDAWTRLQGLVYGNLISQAGAYEGAAETLSQLRSLGATIHLVSHKTQWPALGPRWNLHSAAKDWLADRRFYGENSSENLIDQIWFEQARDAKFERIRLTNCRFFVDDLSEFLLDPQFPQSVQPILFDPANSTDADVRLPTIQSWRELPALLFDLI